MSISENLSMLDHQEIQERNLVNSFLPFRQQRQKTADYDYEAIAGGILSTALNKRVKKEVNLNSFQDAAVDRLTKKLTDQNVIELLIQMYFKGEDLYRVSPEFLLFKEELGDTSVNKHLTHILRSFVARLESPLGKLKSEVNFLESEFLVELESQLEDYKPESLESPYLPFISELFVEDLRFLIQHPGYMLNNMRLFLGLYVFLYSAQLALNINEWRSEPKTKPLYFILDTEKASIERKHVRDVFPWLTDKVADLFPILSMLEYLNQAQEKSVEKYPLWSIYLHVNDLDTEKRETVIESMKQFCMKLREKRGLPALDHYPNELGDMIEQLTTTAKELFSRNRPSQFTVNSRVVNAFEQEIAQHFIMSRGRSGKVLVLSQDYLMLLTNLAIGERQQIQFQELLDEFRKRGVWFDRQSEQAIISFLERIGNVERMSDSGDAVYVRKTI